MPADVYAAWDAKAAGAARETEWNDEVRRLQAKFPEEAAELSRRMASNCRPTWRQLARRIIAGAKERKHRHPQGIQNAIQALAPVLPEFLGGSADLTGSNLTNWKSSRSACAAASRATISATACANSA